MAPAASRHLEAEYEEAQYEIAKTTNIVARKINATSKKLSIGLQSKEVFKTRVLQHAKAELEGSLIQKLLPEYNGATESMAFPRIGREVA
jgi:hypothetical protein